MTWYTRCWLLCSGDVAALERSKKRIDALVRTVARQFIESKVTCGGTKYRCRAVFTDGVPFQLFVDYNMHQSTGLSKWSMWVRCGTYHGTYYTYDSLDDLLSCISFNIHESMTNRHRRVSDVLGLVVEQLGGLESETNTLAV
jgi:hypothetical protein